MDCEREKARGCDVVGAEELGSVVVVLVLVVVAFSP